MQRKNSLLRPLNRSSRKGMAIIMAVAIIVTVATILALSMSLTSQTTKRTTDLYLYEQAVLLSQSASDYGLLKLSQAANPCSLSPINFTYNSIFTIDIDMRYISKAGTPCNASILIGKSLATTTTAESDGTVLMDITVTANAGNQPIRYFRRSIQKL